MPEVGDEIWVLEDNKPYSCKVIDKRNGRLELHFKQWNKRYDIWIEEDSSRIVDGPDVLVCDDSQVSVQPTEAKNKRGRDDDETDDVESSGYNMRKRPSLASDVVGGSSKSLPASSAVNLPLTRDPSVDLTGGTVPAVPPVGGSSSACPSPLSDPVVVSVDVSPQTDVVRAVRQCSLCSGSLSGQVVSCGDCGSGFHSDSLCLGVNQSIIDVLLQDESAVSYRCCRCRGKPGRTSSSQDNGVVSQMMGIIGSLVAEVRKLADTVACIRRGDGGDLPPPEVSRNRPVPLVGNTVMSEVREVYEREKRKSCIIIRGVGDASAKEVLTIFQQICEFLDVGDIHLQEVTRVAPSVWRGKVLNAEKRLGLLSEARHLKNSPDFFNIYVQRDLTYRQRMDVIAKRAQRSNRGTGANATTVAPMVSSSEVSDTDHSNGIQDSRDDSSWNVIGQNRAPRRGSTNSSSNRLAVSNSGRGGGNISRGVSGRGGVVSGGGVVGSSSGRGVSGQVSVGHGTGRGSVGHGNGRGSVGNGSGRGRGRGNPVVANQMRRNF